MWLYKLEFKLKKWHLYLKMGNCTELEDGENNLSSHCFIFKEANVLK